MRITFAHIMQADEQLASVFYIADTLQVIGSNLAGAFGGKTIKVSLRDYLQPSKEDFRTGEEIALDVLSRCGIEVI